VGFPRRNEKTQEKKKMIFVYIAVIYLLSAAILIANNKLLKCKPEDSVSPLVCLLPVVNTIAALVIIFGQVLILIWFTLSKPAIIISQFKIWRKLLVLGHKFCFWIDNSPPHDCKKTLYLKKGDKFVTKKGELKTFNGEKKYYSDVEDWAYGSEEDDLFYSKYIFYP
jgi:hypothetical protein